MMPLNLIQNQLATKDILLITKQMDSCYWFV